MKYKNVIPMYRDTGNKAHLTKARAPEELDALEWVALAAKNNR